MEGMTNTWSLNLFSQKYQLQVEVAMLCVVLSLPPLSLSLSLHSLCHCPAFHVYIFPNNS